MIQKFNLTTRLGNFSFGFGAPFMIAEIGVNHEGNINYAYKMIDECKENNITAVKFQTYKAEKIAAVNSKAYWDTNFENSTSQFKLFKKYDNFNESDYEKIANYCYKKNIIFMSTAFDHDSAIYIDKLVDIHKISSSDITNVPLIRLIASFGKPIILSTGASSIDEIDKAVKLIKSLNSNTLCLLHCILKYPTVSKDAFLDRIPLLGKRFTDCVPGYSDHTLPKNNLLALQLAHSMGALVIEKHYTFNKSLPGNDHYHAFDYADGKDLMNNYKLVGELCGSEAKFNLNLQDEAILNARRGIYIKSNIQKGNLLTEKNLIALRPTSEIKVEEWDNVIGKKVKKDLIAGKPLLKSDYE
jgi:sialic acid synthase SpsE